MFGPTGSHSCDRDRASDECDECNPGFSVALGMQGATFKEAEDM